MVHNYKYNQRIAKITQIHPKSHINLLVSIQIKSRLDPHGLEICNIWDGRPKIDILVWIRWWLGRVCLVSILHRLQYIINEWCVCVCECENSIWSGFLAAFTCTATRGQVTLIKAWSIQIFCLSPVCDCMKNCIHAHKHSEVWLSHWAGVSHVALMMLLSLLLSCDSQKLGQFQTDPPSTVAAATFQ